MICEFVVGGRIILVSSAIIGFFPRVGEIIEYLEDGHRIARRVIAIHWNVGVSKRYNNEPFVSLILDACPAIPLILDK